MRRLPLLCLLAALGACSLPFGRPARPAPPAALRVDFDSVSATARLAWARPPEKGFLRYDVERAGRRGFEVVASVSGHRDTAWVDEGLLADRGYRYRVAAVFRARGDEEELRLESPVVPGGIHRRVGGWSLSDGFLPTRIVLSEEGVLHVLGAGRGWVERFDRDGRPMGRWRYTDSPNACLETATLDAASAAFDAGGYLYVVFNTYVEGGPPQPRWAKLGADGARLWTRPLSTVFARHITADGDRLFVESVSHLQELGPDGELVEHYSVPPLMVSSVRFHDGAFAALVEPLGYDTSGWQAPRLVVYGSVERSEVGRVTGRDPLSPEDRGAGLLNRPTDFTHDTATDRVFVVNGGHDRIEVFRGGEYLTRWGREGADPSAFRFRGEAMVLADVTTGERVTREVVAGGIARDRDGYIYVADTFNNRIQKFAP